MNTNLTPSQSTAQVVATDPSRLSPGTHVDIQGKLEMINRQANFLEVSWVSKEVNHRATVVFREGDVPADLRADSAWLFLSTVQDGNQFMLHQFTQTQENQDDTFKSMLHMAEQTLLNGIL